MKKLILYTLLGLLFFNCSKDDDSSGAVPVAYNQTACADPWGYADDNNALAVKIITFFNTENIKISNVNIGPQGIPEACLACTCLTGKRITVDVRSTDLEAIKAFGFQE